MADNKKTQTEDLKKLEDQAYFELCQIIAEAMQYQDVELLNVRISTWKNKYKKLLDDSPSNSNFKKRIKFLLTQYYSSVTQYILNQLKLKEEKKIEHQGKALKKLYNIIKETNDLNLLKKKVSEWQKKYPIDGFLKMYQKRIKLNTSEKNLKENAFEQEKAFSDLVSITKTNGTIDELKDKLENWEDTYGINDKYRIDDFLKHQSDIKRFTSNEFLQSIARDDINQNNPNEIENIAVYNKSCSPLSVQEKAFASLISISKSSNSIDEMFAWVYKNKDIKFNDKYKELILNATYLQYSPTYLNKLPKPNMDVSKSSLTLDEYQNINNIKKYAIISYFNLLLPSGKSISNDYFNSCIHTIYSKSRKNTILNEFENTSIEDILDSGLQIDLSISSKSLDEIEELPSIVNENSSEDILELEVEITENKDSNETLEMENPIESGEIQSIEITLDVSDITPELTIDLKKGSEETESKKSLDVEPESSICENDIKPNFEATLDSVSDDTSRKTDVKSTKVKPEIETSPMTETKTENEEPLPYDTVIAFSPLFFETINNYSKQAVLVNSIDSAATEYIESQKTKDISLDEPVKTKADED